MIKEFKLYHGVEECVWNSQGNTISVIVIKEVKNSLSKLPSPIHLKKPNKKKIIHQQQEQHDG
jgi:hypothetical protein